MKGLIDRTKQWVIANKYFFSASAVVFSFMLVCSFVFRADVVERWIIFIPTLFFCLITYWLVRGGHYGDMDCE